MSGPGRWLVAGLALLLGRRRRRERQDLRLLPLQPPSPRAELVVFWSLVLAALASAGFVVVYVLGADTQLLGLSLGLAFAFLAAASILAAKALVPQEEQEEERESLDHRRDSLDVTVYVQQADDRLTRKKLLSGAAGAAGFALVGALVVPLASCGSFLGTDALGRTLWRGGRRLVDEDGSPIAADELELGSFLPAFAEGADREELDASLILVRLRPGELELPPNRADWAPSGILAFSKICPHAGCAVSMFRYPQFDAHVPRPALVCPCHYSTFDPARGGELIFGPAGRPLPQLPLRIDDAGELRAGGKLSGPVGPSWWGVRQP